MRHVVSCALAASAALLLAIVPAASADPKPGNGGSATAGSVTVEWVKRCRQADEAGRLEELGATRGECVNRERGPASENARNSIAGLCGVEKFQQESGFGTKGECIQAQG
jgi:hypothetical protein